MNDSQKWVGHTPEETPERNYTVSPYRYNGMHYQSLAEAFAARQRDALNYQVRNRRIYESRSGVWYPMSEFDITARFDSISGDIR